MDVFFPKTYINFDLLIDPIDGGYQARVIDSPVGEAVTQFIVDESIYNYTDLRKFGDLLFRAVFSGDVGRCLHRSIDAVNGDGRTKIGLRIRLRLTTVPELAVLPWEALYDAERDLIFALSEQTPLVRYLELDKPKPRLQVELPLRMLVVISDPVDFGPRLDVEREWLQLHRALADLIEGDKLQLERLPARLAAIQQRLRQGDVHILHFIGHGWYDSPESNGLVMESDYGQTELIEAERITIILQGHLALRLAFLNACEGSHSDQINPFAGVAQRLVQQGVPALIAMQATITNEAAILLSREFYKALTDGYPVDAALSQARLALYSQISKIQGALTGEWVQPALFSRSADNQLFDLLDVLPMPSCPYPGMVPFTKDKALFFFGREHEIAELRRRLRYHNQIFVIGPSGSGKSSLVFAGLLPSLEKQQTDHWQIYTFRPGARPLAALEEALGVHNSNAQDLTVLPFNNHEKILLAIDQFEELFVQASKNEQSIFIDRLKVLHAQKNVALVITMSAEFYPDLMNSALWPIDTSQRLEIAPLRGNQLQQAIEEPAASVGVTLEAGLLERLLADAADEPGVLPLLQETMVLLWEEQKRRVLPMTAYTLLGGDGRSGLAVAMATKADATLASLTSHQQSIARRIFLRMIQFGEGRADTRRQQLLKNLAVVSDDASLFTATVRTLAYNRLLTLSGEADDLNSKVDIAHEMLIVHWPTAREWISQRREAELTRRRLEEKASEWLRLGRSNGGLLDDAELAEAERWLYSVDATDLGYSEPLVALVQQSRQMIENAVIEKAAANRREREQLQKLVEEETKRAVAEQGRTQIFRWATVITTFLLLVASVLAYLALDQQKVATQNEQKANQSADVAATKAAEEAQQRQRADKEAESANVARATSDASAITEKAAREETERQLLISQASQLAARSQIEAATHPQLGLLLSIKALKTLQQNKLPVSSELMGTVNSVFSNIGGWALQSYSDSVSVSIISPDEKWLFAGTLNGTVQLWDLTKMTPSMKPVQEATYTGAIYAAAFSSDSHSLVFGGEDGSLILWDLKQLNFSEHAHILAQYIDPITDIEFSKQWLVDSTGHVRKAEKLFDQAINLHSAINFQGSSSDIALSRDGRWLVESTTPVLLWDLTTLKPVESVINYTGYEQEKAECTDGSGAQRVCTQPHPSRQAPVNRVAFSNDNRWLAVGAVANLYMWDLTNMQVDPIKLPQEHRITSLVFSPDGQWLASAGGERVWQEEVYDIGIIGELNDVYLWHLPMQETSLPIKLKGHSDAISSLAITSDSRWLFTGSKDNTVRLWDLSSNNPSEKSIVLKGHDSRIKTTSISAGNRWLVTGSGKPDSTLRLWSMASLSRTVEQQAPTIFPLLLAEQMKSSAASVRLDISSNNQWVVTSSSNDGALLWDLTARDPSVTSRMLNHNPVGSVKFSRDNLRLALSGEGYLQLWDMRNLDSKPISITISSHDGQFFSPDLHWLVSGESILDLTAQPITTSSFQNFAPKSLTSEISFSPDSKYIALGTNEGEIVLCEFPAMTAILSSKLDSKIRSISFSLDGHWLAAGSEKGQIGLWNLRERESAPILWYDHNGPVSELQFSPNNEWLASSQGLDHIFTGQTSVIGSTMSGDIYVGSNYETDKNARLWNIVDPKPETQPIILQGHTDSVSVLAFSDDSRWLATGSRDNEIRLWSISTSKVNPVPVVLQGHTDDVEDLEFSPDGHWLASAGQDGIPRLWLLNIESLIKSGCNAVGRNLTLIEWQSFFPEQDYPVICDNLPLHPTLIEEAQWLTKNLEITKAIDLYSKIAQLSPSLGINPLQETKRVASTYFIEKGETLLRQGKIIEASIELTKATEFTDTLIFNPALKIQQITEAKKLLDEVENIVATSNITKAVANINMAKVLDPNLDIRVRAQSYIGIGEKYLEEKKSLEQANAFLQIAISLDERLKETATSILASAVKKTLYESSVEQAVLTFEKLQQLDPDYQLDATLSNALCWYGSLQGLAEDVISACQQAVLAQPDNGNYRDSRGLARALIGDISESIEDFTAFILWNNTDKQHIHSLQRKQWIEALQSGQNPFTNEVLNDLRKQVKLINFAIMRTDVKDVNTQVAHADKFAFIDSPFIQIEFGPILGQHDFQVGLFEPAGPVVNTLVDKIGKKGQIEENIGLRWSPPNVSVLSSATLGRWLAAIIIDGKIVSGKYFTISLTIDESKNNLGLTLLREAENLAQVGKVQDASAKYHQLLNLIPELDFDPNVLADQIATRALYIQNLELAKVGELETVINNFQEMTSNGIKLEYPSEVAARRFFLSIRIRELLLQKDINAARKEAEDMIAFYETMSDEKLKGALIANSWNTLCWFGSLKGYAKEVLDACKQAVELGNENAPAYQDSRALARALTGDIDGAISDLEAFVESIKQNKNYDSMREQREAWINTLKSGENPFDEQTLLNLWGE